ncbi:unnamed protein product [Oikopleura dioica]|uniref:glutamate dehydrogenase (NADP(+)) n=1 Tax=Oikopleura dioica TaxID=34765 RepID=E4Y6I7_OIKDI|nr:unnamed protein product [Oikopleura dioica]
MTEMSKYIGANIDVPAGDIGVGEREIGYLFGQFKRMRGSHEGTLTGKGIGYGGTLGRSSSTGFGLIYILQNCFESLNESIVGKKINISGSGNVALFAAQKAIRQGAIVQTLSDSNGFIFCEDGMTESQLDEIILLKTKTRGRLSEILLDSVAYHENDKPWKIACDVALPCATQNELDVNDAKQLVENGCRFIFEGANMPSTAEAIDHFKSSKCVFLPGKAGNAGGVAGSGFEMMQNSQRFYWTEAEFDEKLKTTMTQIWKTVSETSAELGHPGDYLLGANCAGFKIVADAMLANGFC